MVYSILSILWKNSIPEHARKNCKVLRVVYTQGRIIFYYLHRTYVCFRGLPYRKQLFKMEWELLLFLYGTKSRENNGPNAQPAQCKTPSECYKNRYIRTYWPAANWILCLGFCCGSTVCHWWGFFFICSKHFESFQASFDQVGLNMEATITSLRLRVR